MQLAGTSQRLWSCGPPGWVLKTQIPRGAVALSPSRSQGSGLLIVQIQERALRPDNFFFFNSNTSDNHKCPTARCNFKVGYAHASALALGAEGDSGQL